MYLDPCSATCILNSRLKAREGAEYQQGLSEVNLGKSPGMPIVHSPNSWAVSRTVVKDVTTQRQWLCAHPHMVAACLLHGKQTSLISHPLKTRRLLSSLHTILCQARREHAGHRSRSRRTLQRLGCKLSVVNTVSAWVNSFNLSADLVHNGN